MGTPIKVLLIAQSLESLAGLKRLLNPNEFEIVGESGHGPITVTQARSLQPDLVLVTADEPLARTLGTIEALTRGSPAWTVVALVAQFDRERFRRLVLAGARDVLPRGTSRVELSEALVRARQADLARRAPSIADSSAHTGTILTVFSAKGGVGKTTLATNLAVSLARETWRSVVLVDLVLRFGDAALMLDLDPEHDLLQALEEDVLSDLERLQNQLLQGPAGVRVLPAPIDPDRAGDVDPRQVGRLLARLAMVFDFVIVDTATGIDEVTAAALDVSTLALLLTTPDVSALYRTLACLRMLRGWDYSTDKVKLVLNRAGSRTRVSTAETETTLDHALSWKVTNHHAAMIGAAYGRPFVVSQPRSPVAADVRLMAHQLAGLPTEDRRSRWLPRLSRPKAEVVTNGK